MKTSYSQRETLTYRPRTMSHGEQQYWELRDECDYRVSADIYTTDE